MHVVISVKGAAAGDWEAGHAPASDWSESGPEAGWGARQEWAEAAPATEGTSWAGQQ